MEYSTKQGKLIMPEYGRNVQHMVEYALTLEDKTARNECVQAIIQTMENLFPYLRNEESRHKVYDHLAIMSDFRLDIDSPFDEPNVEELRYRPEKMAYSEARTIRFRHYGRIIQSMIHEAICETDEEKRKALVYLIAVRMRQNYVVWNKDEVDEQTIRYDLEILSNGVLSPLFDGFDTPKVYFTDEHPQPQRNYKNKKK